MTLSGYFTSKSVFDQQGCCALTFALAWLSCSLQPPCPQVCQLSVTVHAVFTVSVCIVWKYFTSILSRLTIF